MKKLLLFPTLLLTINLGAATTETTHNDVSKTEATATSQKKERSLKQRYDKWVAKNPRKNIFINSACLAGLTVISAMIDQKIKFLQYPMLATVRSSTLLISVKFIHDSYIANQYQWKKLNQINQLKKEMAQLKKQQQ